MIDLRLDVGIDSPLNIIELDNGKMIVTHLRLEKYSQRPQVLETKH